MKELSIEEKAKRYDEALEKAKKWYDINTNEGYRNIFEGIFPELKESEDEMIRKELICFLETEIPQCNARDKYITWLEKQGKNNMGISEATKQKLEDNLHKALEKETPESWNEFLEKQGEQKPIWHNEDEEPQKDSLILLIMQSGTPIVAKIIEPNHTFEHGERWAYIDDLLEKQDEQKPAWSEDDQSNFNELGSFILETYRTEDASRLITWLEYLKDRVQPKQEWSEEDEDTIKFLISHFCVSHYNRSFQFTDNKLITHDELLEKIRNLRPHWKPSDEQLCALEHATMYNTLNVNDAANLATLYNDLKKLKG